MARPHEIIYPDSEEADAYTHPLILAEGQTSDVPRLDEASGTELFEEVARRAIRNATDDELVEELRRRYPVAEQS